MSSRTAEERRLKTDIHTKNALRRELNQSLKQLHSWQEKIHELGNTRRVRKLADTVARYAAYVDDLREYLAPMLDDLEVRIKEEMKFSEGEIAQFRDEVKEESVQAAEAKAAFRKAREVLEHLKEDDKARPEQLKEAREAYRKAFRTFRLEKRQLSQARGELESELVDKEIFKAELKRIMVERSFISG